MLRRSSSRFASVIKSPYARTINAWMTFAIPGVSPPSSSSSTSSVSPSPAKSVANLFLNAIKPGEELKVEFELYGKTCPMAVENFGKLCSGEQVVPEVTSVDGIEESTFKDQFKPQLHYLNSRIHRVEKGQFVQGGDVTGADGFGQISVFGEEFEAPEEMGVLKLDKEGMIGTAVSAPNMNGSQFFILTAPAPHLEGTCICFGKVIKGMEIIKMMENVSVDFEGKPVEPIVITGCGITTLNI